MTIYRILFSSDLHGSSLVYKKYLNSLIKYKAHLGIIGGDITGKMLVPIIKVGDESYEAMVLGNVKRARSQKELLNVSNDIESLGFYYEIVTKSEYEELSSNHDLLNQLFKEKMLERIKKWVALGEDFIKNYKIPLYIMPGNDDIFEIDDILEHSEYIKNPNEKVIQITNDHEMMASAYSNITPWKCPRDLEEEKLQAILERMMNNVKDVNKLVFISHVPPYNTNIDLAPALTHDLKYVTKGGTVMMTHVGSSAVRRVIEKYQPLVGLHGHIHESRGFDKIGRTMVLNPGSEYGEGILHAVLVTIEEDKVKGYMLISG
ncbi:MAG: metallophosphoesterase [Thermoproteota archaeon]